MADDATSELGRLCDRKGTESDAMLEEARALIAKGASLKSTGWWGGPLHHAAKNGHVKLCELLLKAGANINAQMNNGFTPLHIALEKDQEGVCRLLIEKGANLDLRGGAGVIPRGHPVVKKLLREAGDQAPSLSVGAKLMHMLMLIKKERNDKTPLQLNGYEEDGKIHFLVPVPENTAPQAWQKYFGPLPLDALVQTLERHETRDRRHVCSTNNFLDSHYIPDFAVKVDEALTGMVSKAAVEIKALTLRLPQCREDFERVEVVGKQMQLVMLLDMLVRGAGDPDELAFVDNIKPYVKYGNLQGIGFWPARDKYGDNEMDCYFGADERLAELLKSPNKPEATTQMSGHSESHYLDFEADFQDKKGMEAYSKLMGDMADQLKEAAIAKIQKDSGIKTHEERLLAERQIMAALEKRRRFAPRPDDMGRTGR